MPGGGRGRGGPYSKDYIASGSILVSPYFGKLTMLLQCRHGGEPHGTNHGKSIGSWDLSGLRRDWNVAHCDDTEGF